MQDYRFNVSIINKEISGRIETAKRYGYTEETGDDRFRGNEGDKQSQAIKAIYSIIEELSEAGIDPFAYSYYESYYIVEDLRCNKLKKVIFEMLSMLDKKETINVDGVSVSKKEVFKKDTLGSWYSIHLAEILEAVNDIVEEKYDKPNNG